MGEVVTKRETPALYDEIDRLRAELANAQAPLTTILAVAEACGLLVLEPREMYDQALVGVTCAPQDHWPRKTAALCAVYSVSRCLAALGAEMAEDEALDWFDFNTRGAWVGEGHADVCRRHGRR